MSTCPFTLSVSNVCSNFGILKKKLCVNIVRGSFVLYGVWQNFARVLFCGLAIFLWFAGTNFYGSR